MNTRFVRALASGVVVAALVTGCSSAIDGHAVPGGPGTQGTPGAPQRTPKPPDRDPRAVAAAVNQLDPCKVFDMSVAAKRHKKMTPSPSGVHACWLSPENELGISFSVVANDQHDRYEATPVVLAGVRAYRIEDTSRGQHCQFEVPVSHVLALRFSYSVNGGTTSVCGPLQEYVEGSLKKLRNPASAAWSGKPPVNGWDGCTLLATVLGKAADTVNLAPEGTKDPYSGCVASRHHDESEPSPVTGARLRIEYDVAPSMGEQRQIAGKTVWMQDDGERCQAAWSEGPSYGSAADSVYSNTVVRVGTDNGGCAQATTYAQQVMDLLQQKPPSVTPQQPLFYAPGDNDTGSVGACLDFGATGGQVDCEPYHPVQLPQGGAAIVAAGGTNLNVACAVSEAAVHKDFGASFQAVTWGQHCNWVDDAHVVQVIVDVVPGLRPSEFGHESDTWVDRTETTIGGRPAVTFWTTTHNEFDIYIAPTGGLSDPGIVHIGVLAMGGRGHVVDLQHLHLEPADATKAQNAMTTVAQTYFTA